MMLKLSPLALLLAGALALPACADSPDAKTEAPAAASAPKAKAKKAAKPAAPADAPVVIAPAAPTDELVVLETSAGEVVIDLYEDKTPGHAENFKKLVRQGYYDGSPFHRVIDGFMAQGGGQWSEGQPGGIGDVGYTQPAEIVPGLLHVRGSVAAARMGDPMNPERRSSGSQFYICFVPTPFLDAAYTVFGEVVTGMDIVDKLTKGAPRSGAVAPEQASKILRAWLKPKDGSAATK